MKYDIVLATTENIPACTARAEVEATTDAEAHLLALQKDFDELEWTDDRGNSVPSDEIDFHGVTVAVV